MFKKERITKIQAAERQLQEAIRLFFERRDPIAIHTLAAASHEILSRLAESKNIYGFFKNPDYIKDSRRKEYFAFVNKYKNFYFSLYGAKLRAANVWRIWFSLKYPQLINDGEYKDLLKNITPPSLSPDNFEAFLKAALKD